MEKTENSDALTKISSAVSERDKRIWENEAFCVCINKETEKLNGEISRMKSATEEMEKEDKVLEEQLEELTKCLTIQEATLRITEKSLLTHIAHKEDLAERANKMKKKYAKTLEQFQNEYQEYRSLHEISSESYKELRAMQIELKRLEIYDMDLEVKIENLKRSQKQYEDIQQQIFQNAVVKFARFYTLYHKNERIKAQLAELKNEEKHLLKQHLELTEAVKQKQKKKKLEMNQARMENYLKIDANNGQKSSIHDFQLLQEKKESTNDKLAKFLSEEIETFTLTVLDSSKQQPQYNQDKSKIRILDVKVMNPPAPPKPRVVKPNLNLRKKMKDIIETTKKSALKSGSVQTTPVSSQQLQNRKPKDIPLTVTNPKPEDNLELKKKLDIKKIVPKSESVPVTSNCPQKSTGVSQTMTNLNLDDKMSTVQENISVNPILKQAKEETISKFFNNKKKSVTFKTEKCQNMIEKNDKFSFQTETQTQKTVGLFQFADKEQKSLDIFAKPFAFRKDVSQKPEEKKFEKPFGIFDLKKPNPTPDSEVISTSVTGGSCTGSSNNSEKKTEEESFDPFSFNASFNRSFGESPKKNSDQSSDAPKTFNFFGSQNSNLFNMF